MPQPLHARDDERTAELVVRRLLDEKLDPFMEAITELRSKVDQIGAAVLGHGGMPPLQQQINSLHDRVSKMETRGSGMTERFKGGWTVLVVLGSCSVGAASLFLEFYRTFVKGH